MNTVIALSENQSAWVATLAAGFVVLLVVIGLLEGLRRAVVALNDDIWSTWVSGKAALIRIGVHAIDEQVRPIESEVRGINGALQKVANALVNATR